MFGAAIVAAQTITVVVRMPPQPYEPTSPFVSHWCHPCAYCVPCFYKPVSVAGSSISAWDQFARDYESGKITFEESIRRSAKLIECSLCKSRSPDLDPFGSRRSRTTVTGARGRSRGTGPRATGKNVTHYRRARACPSPCVGRESKHPWSLGCGHFPPRSVDCGGQAPALREKIRNRPRSP